MKQNATDHPPVGTPWLTPKEAADRAKVGVGTIYTEVRSGRLRAAKVGGRRALRFKSEFVDSWLESTSDNP